LLCPLILGFKRTKNSSNLRGLYLLELGFVDLFGNFSFFFEAIRENVLQVTSVKELSGQICQICGDEIEITVDGEPFVACNECAFPVCRPCYEYERREGNQACPQCKTRYKRIKGVKFTFFSLFCFRIKEQMFALFGAGLGDVAN